MDEQIEFLGSSAQTTKRIRYRGRSFNIIVNIPFHTTPTALLAGPA